MERDISINDIKKRDRLSTYLSILHCHTRPHPTLPNQTGHHHTEPYLTAPNHALPRRVLLDECKMNHTSPRQTAPNRTSPRRTSPDQTSPDLTTPYFILSDECEMIHTKPDRTTPNRTLPYHTEPYHTAPGLTLFLSVQSFNGKTSMLGAPITETDLSSSISKPGIYSIGVNDRIIDVDDNRCTPRLEGRAHAGNAGSTHPNHKGKMKALIFPQLVNCARTFIVQFCMLITIAGRFSNHSFFRFLGAIDDHGFNHKGWKDRSIFIKIQTAKKFDMRHLFIICLGLYSLGRNLFEQFRPLVEWIRHQSVVHYQLVGRCQFVTYLFPCHD